MNSALGDGLVDMGQHIAAPEPQKYPIANYVNDLTFMNTSDPLIGQLQFNAAWNDVAANDSQLRQEWLDQGIMPLLPSLMMDNSWLLCAGDPVTSLADMAGKQVTASTTALAHQIEAMGGTVVSVPSAEIFEAMQRNVLDCGVLSGTVADVNGLLDVADNWTRGKTANFTGGASGFSMSLATWNSLPLIVQQLLWDRLDVYLDQHVKVTQLQVRDAIEKKSADSGVAFNEWEPAAEAHLRQYFDDQLAKAPELAPATIDGAAFVAEAKAAHEKWFNIATNDAGISDDIAAGQAGAWADAHPESINKFIDALVTEVVRNHRPGGNS